MSDEINILKRALARERLARKEAEKILESKSGELYKANVELRDLNKCLEDKVEERTLTIRKREKSLSVLFDNSPFPKLVISKFDGKLLEANVTAEKMFGFSKESFRKLSLSSLFLDSSSAKMFYGKKMIENLNKIESKMLKSDSSVIHVEIFVSEILYDDQVAQILTVNNIESRKQFERKTLENEIRFKALVESVSDVIFRIDKDGRVIYINESGEYLLGYSSDEIMGVKFYSFLHDENKKDVLQFYLTQYEMQTLSSYTEFSVVKKNGAVVWLGVSVDLVYNSNGDYEYIALARDITERMLSQKELEKSEEKYRMIIENLELGLLEVDADEFIVKAYPKFCKMFGFDEKELIGNKPADFLLDSEYRKLMSEQVAKRKKGESGVYEVKIICADGSEKWVLISGAPFYDSQGEFAGSLGIHLDITDRRGVEDKLKEAKLLAEQSVASKEMFMANMSHEIRTPMNAIIGMGGLLSAGNLEEKEKEYVAAINYSAENLLSIINDILDFSKIESGNLDVHQDDNSLNEVILGIKRTFDLKADAKGLSFNITMDENNDFYRFDALRLSQVLINLVGNSIKFTQDGVVDLKIQVVKSTGSMDTLMFSVSDTGMGIQRDNLDKIFRSFSQADSFTSKKYGGTGLGLSISKSLIEKMGGVLSVESVHGEGSVFSFTIEMVQSESSQLALEHAELSERDFEGLKVLLVDDNKVNLFVAQTMLEKGGVIVETAANGFKAVELVSSENFDVVLMDVRMPEMDGYEATKCIREELNLDVPIIALTANAIVGDSEKCIEAGMNNYLAKPFSQKELFQKINEEVDVDMVNVPINSDDVLPLLDGVVDLTLLHKNTGGDKKFMNEMIQLYLDTSNEDVELMKKSLEENDLVLIGRIAHKLKPSICNMAKTSLSELVEKVEVQGQDGDSLVVESTNLLLEKLDQLSKQLATYLSQNK